MDIYDIDGRKIVAGDVIAELPVTKDCKHVEELMKSNHVAMSWQDTKQYQLSAGTYIIPFPDEKNPYNGSDPRYPIKYRLFENYLPDCKNEEQYSYAPEFQHPVMWLSRIPLVLITGDVTGWTAALKKTSWGYTGTPLHIAMFITDCINWLSDNYEEFGEVFGKGWYSVVDSDLAPSATINFESVDIMSGAGLIAQAFDCEYHFDFARKEFRLGTISYGTKVTLKTGVNVGVADVSRTKKDFHNAFLVKGSTRNLSQPTDTGENIQVMERLMLNPEKYPDGIMYTDDDGNIVSRNQFLALDVPMLMQELIFDDIFPTLELYLYNTRERKCWLLDNDGNKVPDDNGEIDPDDGNRYKAYSKWYTRLAYPIYETDEHGVKTLTKWEDYKLGAYSVYAKVKQIEGRSDTHAGFYLDLSYHSNYFTTRSKKYPGSEDNPNYIIRMTANGYTVTGYVQREYDGSRCYVYSEYGFSGDDDRDETNPDEMRGFAYNLKVGDKVEFVFGVDPQKFPEENVDGKNSVIKGRTLNITFIPNYEEGAANSLLIGQGDFEAVYYDEDTKEHEDDDISAEAWEVQEGEYRIVQKESDNFIIPTTSKGGIYPIAAETPELTNNKATLLNIVVDDVYKLQAQQDLEMVAKRKIGLLRSDLNNYTLPSDPTYFEDNNLRLHIGQSVEYDNGQDLAGGTSYKLDTHIIKIETQIDYPWQKEITVGNEKVKSSITTLQDQVNTVIGGGFLGSGSGSSGSGGTINDDQLQQIIANYGSSYFLSKTVDDQASGLIGFLKGAWFGAKEWLIDATGSANLYDVTVNGLLKAYNAVINTVKSTAYSGDGMLDTGWRITDRYEGNNSKATFDYLYIRKKALFEELEIRKISHIGGDFALSPASGRAYRVEYYDADGEQLGVDEMTVPWMLGYKMMLLFSRSMANKYLGRRKKVDRQLKPEELSLVRRVRVYLFSDDGTTKTMSNWTVGAQARCQSFNITEQMDYHGSGVDSNNPDVSYWTGRKVQNTYWWRLVNAVGQGRLSDGKTHSYIEFLANTGNDIVVADTGSDLPAVGDEFCQFGHRTRPELSNVIMIETAREDSPSFKMYAGINSWDLTGKRVSVQSPTGWKVMSNSFEWITSYGELFKPTVNRGMWIDIEPDEQGKRRCYFNDMVSHNGAYWRCIVNEGTYTTDEPSESSAAWQKEVYAAIAPYLKFSDALVAVPCEKDSKATAALSKTVTVKIMVTNLEATITSITMTNQDSHVYLSGNNVVVSFAKGDSVPNKDYVLTVSGDLNGNHYTATDAISVYAVARGDDAYEVTTSPEIFIFSQQEDEPYNINIDKTENGNSSLKVIVKRDGQDQSFRITGVTASGKDSDGQATTMSATYNNTSKRVWITAIGNTTETGNLNITVNYGNNATQTITVPVYCNLIGTWKEKVVGDTKTEIAERTLFDICDETGAVIGTTTLANYTKSSSSSTATLQKQTAALAVEDARLAQELQTTKTTLESSISTTQSTLESEITSTSSTLSTAIANAKTELKGDVNTVSTNLATYEQSNDRAVSALSTRVSNNETAITSTNTRVSTAEGDIQTIQTTVTSQGQQISATNTRVSTAEGDITTLQSQTAALAAEDTRLAQELQTTKTELEGSIEDAEDTLNATITSTANTLNSTISSTKTELKGDVNTVSTNLATYEQSNDRAVSALTTRVSNNETEITNTNTHVSTAEGNISTLTSQMAGTTSSGLKTQISATNTRIDTAESSIQTISSESKEVIDVSKWENGSTTGETVDKTYESMKYDNNTRIRLKTLIPITANTAISMANTSYRIAIIYFNTSKKSVAYSGSSALRTWVTGSDSVITGHPSAAAYIAILLCKVSGGNIATSEVPATKLYISDSAYSTTSQTSTMISNAVSGLASTGYVDTTATNVRAGIKSDLGDTGIDIDAETITLKGNKVTFTNTAGTVTDKVKIDATNGTLEAANAKLTGELVIQYGNNDGLKLDSSGNIMRWNGSSWVNFFAQRYAKVVSGSSYTCGTFDDFLLASTDDMKIYLPSSPENGRQISVRNIGTGRQCILKSKYQFVTGGGPDVGYESPYYYVVLYNDDRAELVFYNNKWYWNAMAT